MYQELKREIKNIWGIRHIEVVPIVVGALGGVSKRLDGWLTKLGIAIKKGLLQKTALLGTAGSGKLNKRECPKGPLAIGYGSLLCLNAV